MKLRVLLLALGLFTAAGLSALGAAWIDGTSADGPPARAWEAAQQWIANVEVHEAGIPVSLRIPRFGIDARVEQVGQTASGAMDAPSGWDNVGWYEPGVRPGEPGSAVMAGHLDSETEEAVFWDLHKLKPGDTVEVLDDRGDTRTFVVEALEIYDDSDAPLQKIFAESDGKRLNLITCDGAWSKHTQTYSQRLVVYTKLIDEDLTNNNFRV